MSVLLANVCVVKMHDKGLKTIAQQDGKMVRRDTTHLLKGVILP